MPALTMPLPCLLLNVTSSYSPYADFVARVFIFVLFYSYVEILNHVLALEKVFFSLSLCFTFAFTLVLKKILAHSLFISSLHCI